MLFKFVIATALICISYCPTLLAEDVRAMKDKYRRYDLGERMRNEVSVSSNSLFQIMFHDRGLPDRTNLFYRIRPLVGFEEKRDSRSARRFDFSVGSMTLSNALDLLVKNDSEYSWTLAEGVVAIGPKQSALDVRVPEFFVVDSDIYTAAESLFGQLENPEFAETQKGFRTMGLPQYRTGGPRLNIHLINPTLRDCLNELVRRDGYHDWYLRYFSQKGRAPALIVYFLARPEGVRNAHKRAEEDAHKNFEAKSLRDGFKKANDGTWFKAGQ